MKIVNLCRFLMYLSLILIMDFLLIYIVKKRLLAYTGTAEHNKSGGAGIKKNKCI